MGSLLDALPDGVVAVDARGRVRLVNPACEELLETSQASALGRPLAELGPGGAALAPCLSRVLAERRQVREGAVRWLGRLGAARGVEVSAAPRERGGAVAVLHDVGDPLDALGGSARSALYATFAAGVAHEVRNPLGGIRGAVQLLAAELPPSSPLGEHVRVALREVDRLTALTSRLLELGRPSPGVAARVDLHAVLDGAIAACRAVPVRLERSYDPSLPAVSGDADGLHRMFVNLLENAIHASPPGGRITVATGIEVGRSKEGAPLVRATITDDGPGVPPEVEARLFLPFASAKPGGTGLGLALARKVAIDHGGALVHARAPGRGASFTVVLPAEGR